VEPLPAIPPLDSRVGIRLHEASDSPRWAVELAARMVAGQDRVARSLLETPTAGFTTWDVRSFWQPWDFLNLVAGVENFTDRNYREHFDFRAQNGFAVYQPGVNFYFGTELTY
jgi:outer membrane receptor protein involved in Fe transport